MTREEFKAYLDMVVEKAFKEGVLYERNRRKFGYDDDENWLAMEIAIDNAKVNILCEQNDDFNGGGGGKAIWEEIFELNQNTFVIVVASQVICLCFLIISL